MPDHPTPTSAPCTHFGVCGGCANQDQPYAAQLEAKGEALRAMLRPWRDAPVPVTPSPRVWHYRNKVDLNFGVKYYDEPPPPGFVRDTVLGFKKKGRWFHPFEVEQCLIAPKGADALIASVRRWAHDGGMRGFDSRTGEGFLKILLLREGARTGERMVVLVTGPGEIDREGFVEAVLAAGPATSIHHGVSDSPAGIAFAETTEVLHGKPDIEEHLHLDDRVLRFRISPFSFFQVNTLAAELLYAQIRDWVAETPTPLLIDLYGGAGGIAFACAGSAERVLSVENVASATEDGRHNAAVNGIGHVEFVTEKVKNQLKWMLLDGTPLPPGTVAVTDPPRAGMTPKAVRRLIELRPDHLIYVSCNPAIFTRDELPQFMEAYRIEDARAFDLFPHTPHVELLVRMRPR